MQARRLSTTAGGSQAAAPWSGTAPARRAHHQGLASGGSGAAPGSARRPQSAAWTAGAAGSGAPNTSASMRSTYRTSAGCRSSCARAHAGMTFITPAKPPDMTAKQHPNVTQYIQPLARSKQTHAPPITSETCTQTALQEDSSITLDESTCQSHCWTADHVWQGAPQGRAQHLSQSAVGTDWRPPTPQLPGCQAHGPWRHAV